MFEIVTASTNRSLLSADELRVAAGLAPTDTSDDGRLRELGERASDAIARFCCVASDGVSIPTLTSESCRDTIRLDCASTTLSLSRRFVTAVSLVTEAGVTLSATDYEIGKAAGVLRRLYDDAGSQWAAGKVVVEYTAGFSTVPSDLKHATELLVRQMSAQTARDPTVRRERVDGVGEMEYWVGSIDGGNGAPFTSDVMALLAPYRTLSI